jgi:hypothetical protein
MATAEVELKSPFVPLFKGGIFSVRFLTLFDKACPESYRREGKGRFSNRMTLELYSELLGQDTSCSGIVRSDTDIGMIMEERKNG